MSLGCKFVSSPAKSPGLSNTGPEVILIPEFNSLASTCANVVFPRPGGPWNKVWSRASSLKLAAATKTFRFFKIESWPKNSSNPLGLRALSKSL